MKLLEAYAPKLEVASKVYAREHGGATLDESKKIVIARVLANTSAFLNESFAHSAGTQRADMGNFKKFALNLTSVALPNTIASDLVITTPMSSMVGYIQYIKFVSGSDKGGVKKGDVFNDPFALGKMTDERMNFTAAAVAEEVTVDENGKFTLAWTPIYEGFKPVVVGNSGAVVTVVDPMTGECSVSGATGDIKVKYCYDNAYIPANDLPVYSAKVEGIALAAKVRRISIFYSNLAQFQAKTELGVDLGDLLKTQACAELTYEIDNEIIRILLEGAKAQAAIDGKTVSFNKHKPVGVSLKDHLATFALTVAEGSQIIYDRTQKHNANYMVCASDVATLLSITEGFKAAATGKINGPYFAGTLTGSGVKVYVSPIVAPGHFILGFNGDDMMTSAAVFAPYMALVPTQLLGFADGAMSQGYATMYDAKLLNPALLVEGTVIDSAEVIETHANA